MSPHVEAIADEFTATRRLARRRLRNSAMRSSRRPRRTGAIRSSRSCGTSPATSSRGSRISGRATARSRGAIATMNSCCGRVTERELLREMGAGMARAAGRARRAQRRRSAGHGHDSSSAAADRSGAAAIAGTHRLSRRSDRLPGQADSQRRLAMSEYPARRGSAAHNARGADESAKAHARVLDQSHSIQPPPTTTSSS